MIVLLYCIKDEKSQEIKNKVRYHTIVEPRKADADGLIECLSNALRLLGIDNVLDKASVLRGRPILIGGGTDGASVNIGGQNGMKSKLQESIGWLHWS